MSQPMRFCKDPCCGKQLRIRNNEIPFNFNKREYCSRKCAAQHFSDKGLTKPNKWKATDIAKSEAIGLVKLEPDHNPDLCHSLHIGGSRLLCTRPCNKTEEEIERMHEYNKMMGRV